MFRGLCGDQRAHCWGGEEDGRASADGDSGGQAAACPRASVHACMAWEQRTVGMLPSRMCSAAALMDC